jgi:hypothetical protein
LDGTALRGEPYDYVFLDVSGVCCGTALTCPATTRQPEEASRAHTRVYRYSPLTRVPATSTTSQARSALTATSDPMRRTRSSVGTCSDGERQARWLEQLPVAFLAERVELPGGGSVSRFEMLLATREHELQHRAQLTVIDRLIGVIPRFTGLA